MALKDNISGFFSRYQRHLDLNIFTPLEELILPRRGQIWKAKLNDYYIKIQCVAYRFGQTVVVYNRCEISGLYISLRTGEGDDEVIFKQPLFLNDYEFVQEYEKFKDI